MARSRNIKPGFFKNEDLAECTPWARLCFAGLWTLADRDGRLEDRPKRIKGELFPFDAIEVEPLLQELERFKFILRYEIDGFKAIQILEFARHQSPHYSEAKSTIKPPDFQGGLFDDDPQTPGGLPEDSGKDGVIKRGSQPPDSLIPDSLIQKKKHSSGKPDLSAGFVALWAEWPNTDRKAAKAKCAEKWRSLGLEEHAAVILAHVREQKASNRQWRDGFEPAPMTYLNQRRWEDGVPAGSGAEMVGREDLGDGRYRQDGRIYGADGRPEVVF